MNRSENMQGIGFKTCLLTAAIASALVCSVAGAQPMSPEIMQQVQGLIEEKATRSPVQQKIGSHLIYAGKLSRGEPIASHAHALPLRVRTDAGGRALVDISAAANQTVLQKIADLGGTVLTSFPRYRAIRAWLPLSQMEELAALPDVGAIRPAAEPIHHKLTTSEGDVAHRANLARSTFGVDGSGIKVGVVSDSIDNLAAVQSSGDVGSVTVLPGDSGVPGTGEGTALLEIVYDLAPGASPFFATAGNSEAAMATNIQALRAAGCDIIVDDISFFSEPVFQDGIIAQAVETVAADGALYVSAAGNNGNEDDGTSGTWEGDFTPSSSTISVSNTTEVLHDFGGGTIDPITAEADQPPVVITLQWSDAFGASGNDYDLFIISGNTVVAASTDSQTGTGDPIEAVDITTLKSTGLSVVIGRYSGEARYLHLDTNGGELAINTAGEMYGHPTAVDAISVAAVNAAGRTTPFTGGAADPVEVYSSDGPRRVFYQADGTPITPGNFSSTGGSVRQKPDVAAADCVAVSTPGFDPFCGTSAGSAHAAAIAALVKSANPALTNSQLRTMLTSTALDIEAPGFDRDSGFGLLDAFAAVQSVIAVATATPTTSPTRRVTPTSTPPAIASSAPAAPAAGAGCSLARDPHSSGGGLLALALVAGVAGCRRRGRRMAGEPANTAGAVDGTRGRAPEPARQGSVQSQHTTAGKRSCVRRLIVLRCSIPAVVLMPPTSPALQ
ncbi:MAG: S8 family peptidase [Candidatus Binatia bacterium]